MLSDSQFARVIYTLRIADAYYFAEARCRRAFQKPAHHAKRRAAKLRLQIDTGKATRLPNTQVYAKRRPQVIQTYSPVVESNTYATTTTWVTGPTANDLLMMNAALSEHLTRTFPVGTCDQLMYPHGFGPSRAHRSRPDVPLDAIPYLDPSSQRSSGSSASPGAVIAPEDEHEPLKIRINIKRKSCDDGPRSYIEKRPKAGGNLVS
ncbi:hypothetical protein AN958_12129 [Leucoagaricus sp. SymC.cos]|nr:hypothetical protein AN958_12129 [Leucoagaricus sp. SymC.cos]